MSIVLDVAGLTVERGNQPILQDISFQLASGTDTAIVGPNGAGKTTLVQAILGILPVQSGQIRFAGATLQQRGSQAVKLRQQIAYLPQNFLFDRRMPITVTELVNLGWEYLRLNVPWANRIQRRQAVQQALDQVEATHLQHRLLSELSGGETKRVLLAYCLVRQRQLLILDEAPAGLDMQGEAEFYQLLYQLKQTEGWAILQISHDLEMVRQHCHQVLCLNRRLLCQGHPEQALSPESLSQVYGSAFVRYRHRH